ncbi:hypothetical protein GQ53DRAFT_837943 [Thozetella sp. PMI_491]|nr:hypothetical protein GQ53DRAFT_837943 [Thozetella sp. PMI_491]
MIPSIALVITALFGVVDNVQGRADGIVGFGISLYPDLCCQACHDSLSALYLSCTTFSDGSDGGSMAGMDGGDMSGMDMMGMTSDECYATNTPWLQTMAYCIQQNCNADGYPADKQAECFSNQAVGGASSPTLQESLPSTPPTEVLAADATWLNETSLVNPDVYFSTHGTEGEFARSEYAHTKYSVAIYFVTIGIIVVAGLVSQAAVLFPGLQKQLQLSSLRAKLQQHVFLPALFGSRRLEPLPGRTGYLPGRTLSIFISIYVILNVVFSAVSYESFQPNIFFMSTGFELCEYVGNRTGTLSLVNMSIAILFAGRNNLLISLTGWSQTTFLILHRWTARVAAVQAVVHSIVYTLAYFEPGYDGASAYAAKATEPFYWWGIFATIAMCLAAGLAVLPFRLKLYEIFLGLHIVLVVLTLVGCWYHLVPHFGFDYGYQVWLYISFAFWAFDRVARVARVAFYSHIGNSRAIVEEVPGTEIMQITIFPRVAWGFGPAQHTFLYLPDFGKFWESHPFSVAGWRMVGQPAHTIVSRPVSISNSNEKVDGVEESRPVGSPPESASGKQEVKPARGTQAPDITPSIRFLVRTHSGVTSSLRNRLLATGSSVDISAYTEGPYAGHRVALQPLYTADTVLCIAGGIGITHILGVVQQYASTARQGGESHGNSRGMKATRFIVAWSARESALIEHVRQHFLVDAEGIEYTFWCTGLADTEGKLTSPEEESHPATLTTRNAAAKSGRMNIKSVLQAAVESGRQTTVMVCAPGGMADEVTKQVVNCVKNGGRIDLVEETFAW